MPHVHCGTVKIYAERRGDGPPLLFISGTGSQLAAGPTGFDLPFAGSFDLICYDQRGLGRSDRPSPTTRWSMADYADDAAALLDWAGWDTAAVLGVSFGGMVAQELLLRHPDRISRAVLACTSSGGRGGSSYPLHELADVPTTERVNMTMPLIDTRWADLGSDDPLHELLVRVLSETPPPDAGARAQLHARSRHDTWQRLSLVTVPVLVCAGRYDGLAPLANSEAVAAQIPGARLAVYDGGHGFLHQDPTATRDIEDFLREA